MNSILHVAFIKKQFSAQSIQAIVAAISSQPWFRAEATSTVWLNEYLSALYSRGLVLQDGLALCGLAAARHRFDVKDDVSERGVDAYSSNIAVMRLIFGLTNQNPKLPADSTEARALARRLMRLHKSGYFDPGGLSDLLKSLEPHNIEALPFVDAPN